MLSLWSLLILCIAMVIATQLSYWLLCVILFGTIRTQAMLPTTSQSVSGVLHALLKFFCCVYTLSRVDATLIGRDIK
jgi:hypothetical protein